LAIAPKDVAMVTNFIDKICVLANIPSFVALVFGNGLEYWNINGQVKSTLNVTNLEGFDTVTP